MESNPFLSFEGMILLVCRDAFFGIRLREPASSFLVVEAAEVSLELVVTFLSVSRRSRSNSLLDLTSALFAFEVRVERCRNALCRVVG